MTKKQKEFYKSIENINNNFYKLNIIKKRLNCFKQDRRNYIAVDSKPEH